MIFSVTNSFQSFSIQIFCQPSRPLVFQADKQICMLKAINKATTMKYNDVQQGHKIVLDLLQLLLTCLHCE